MVGGLYSTRPEMFSLHTTAYVQRVSCRLDILVRLLARSCPNAMTRDAYDFLVRRRCIPHDGQECPSYGRVFNADGCCCVMQ